MPRLLLKGLVTAYEIGTPYDKEEAVCSFVVSHRVFVPPVIIQVKYWCLPFCLAAVDVLQSQNPMAAIPHFVGVLTGK